MSKRLWVVFGAVGLVGLLGPAPAEAQPTCPPDVRGCHAEDADWAYNAALFDTVDFDTGWVPSGSPLQLRLTFVLAGETDVEVGGTPTASWPPPIEARVPGRPGTGYLRSNYGLELRLYFRFEVEVPPGITYDEEFEIDIPSIPMDLRAFDETGWDPFLFPPADPALVSDATEDITVVEVGLGSLGIPGVGGGLRADANLSLDTSYQTLRIVVDDGDALPIITMPDQASILVPTGSTANYGAFRDYTVRPEGILEYLLRLNVIPTVFLEVAGVDFTFPVATLPIELADLMEDVVFDDVTIHVPLPDVDIRPRELDFGSLPVGESEVALLTIENAGEAELEVEFDPAPAGFTAPTELITVPPMSSRRVEVGFAPTMEGPAFGMLLAQTNDPDTPTVLIRLRGEGTVPLVPDAGADDMGVQGDAGTPGGVAGGSCGCRTAGGERHPAAPLALLALGAALVIRRRR